MPGFLFTYLNYEGPIEGWSAYLVDYFKTIPDKYVIFALDDYLLNAPIDMEVFHKIEPGDCVKLCKNTPEESEGYPVTTQYCIWNREALINLLAQTTTPWHFEISGSNIWKEAGMKTTLAPCLDYYTNSALSSRWKGIKYDGLSEEDINHIKTL